MHSEEIQDMQLLESQDCHLQLSNHEEGVAIPVCPVCPFPGGHGVTPLLCVSHCSSQVLHGRAPGDIFLSSDWFTGQLPASNWLTRLRSGVSCHHVHDLQLSVKMTAQALTLTILSVIFLSLTVINTQAQGESMNIKNSSSILANSLH